MTDFDEFQTHWDNEHQSITEGNSIPLMNGVVELLGKIESINLPMAVATSSNTERAKAKLRSSGILDYFNIIIGGDQVTRSKPDSEIYLKAASDLSLDPKKCLAFEDSNNGVKAAVAAGMTVVQIPDLVQPDAELLGLGHIVLDSLTDVAGFDFKANKPCNRNVAKSAPSFDGYVRSQKGIHMILHKRLSILALVSFLCVGCDQSTKVLADKFLPRNEMLSYFFGSIRLGYVENTGAFLSLGHSLPSEYRFWILTVATGAILLALLLYLLINSNFKQVEFIGCSLFLVGGASNIYDRATNNGAVIDFLNVGLGPIRTGVFNIADVVVMMGFGTIIFAKYTLEVQRKRLLT